MKKEELDALMDDWFDRDGETFVRVSTKDRIGWEKRLSKDSAYSEFFLEAPTQKDLITRAYSLARDTVAVMNPPFKVHVQVSPHTSSFTDSKVLHVSTEVLDSTMPIGDRLDAFLGLAVHEGCHLLWTDFKKFKAHITSASRKDLAALKLLFNIIEDERIEVVCGEEKPGLARFLEKVKYYMFDHKFFESEPPAEDRNPFERIMTTLLGIIRFPKYLYIEDFEYFGDRLVDIKEVLFPFPTTTDGSWQAAKKIFEIIKDLYEDKLREEEEKRREATSEEGEEGKGDTMTISVGVGSPEDSDDSDSEETPSKGSEGDESSSGTPGVGEKELPVPMTKEEIEESFGKDSERIMEKLSEAISKGFETGELDKGSVAKDLSRDRTFGKVLEGELEIGKARETYFLKGDKDSVEYARSLERVKRYIPAIRNTLINHCKDYKLIHKSMRSGVLDTTKLAEAYQGVSTVYVREGEVKTDRIGVVVLIDESGSMSGARIQAARDAAILLNEAFGGINNLELFIYGHTGDTQSSQSTDLRIYREKGFYDKIALGGIEARSQNRDGVAIREVVDRVRKQTKEHCLFFILSDGQPAACGYGGNAGIQDTKRAAEYAEKQGFSVIQVCIAKTYDPGLMFRHYIELTDMSRLAPELAKAIRRATVHGAKVRMT